MCMCNANPTLTYPMWTVFYWLALGFASGTREGIEIPICLGLCPKWDPNANGFAFWWNIGQAIYFGATIISIHMCITNLNYPIAYSISTQYEIWEFLIWPMIPNRFRYHERKIKVTNQTYVTISGTCHNFSHILNRWLSQLILGQPSSIHKCITWIVQ